MQTSQHRTKNIKTYNRTKYHKRIQRQWVIILAINVFNSLCFIVVLNVLLADGIKFYRSENGVILSKGDSNGCIPTKYFKRAYDRQTRKFNSTCML